MSDKSSSKLDPSSGKPCTAGLPSEIVAARAGPMPDVASFLRDQKLPLAENQTARPLHTRSPEPTGFPIRPETLDSEPES